MDRSDDGEPGDTEDDASAETGRDEERGDADCDRGARPRGHVPEATRPSGDEPQAGDDGEYRADA